MVQQTNYDNADIILSLSRDEVHVALKVYDILEREVATIINEFQNAGSYNYQLSSGVYFYQLKAGNFVQTKKMILMK